MPVQEIEELKEQFINGLTPLRIYLFALLQMERIRKIVILIFILLWMIQ